MPVPVTPSPRVVLRPQRQPSAPRPFARRTGAHYWIYPIPDPEPVELPPLVLGEYPDPESINLSGQLTVEMPELDLATTLTPDPEGIGVVTTPGRYQANTVLNGALLAGAMTIPVVDGSDFGSSVQKIVIDPETDNEEWVLTEVRVDNTFHVATDGRGYAGTTDIAHADGAVVKYP